MERRQTGSTLQSATAATALFRPTSAHRVSNTTSKRNHNTIVQSFPTCTPPNPSSSTKLISLTFQQLESTAHPNTDPKPKPFYNTTLRQAKTDSGTPIWTKSEQGKRKKTKQLESWHKATRRTARYKKKASLSLNLPTRQHMYHTQQCCIHDYGFCADANTSLQTNFNNTLKIYNSLNQFTNLTYHDLCTINKPPSGTQQLLGLNLKYCLSSNTLQNNIPCTVQKMAYSIRTKFQLQRLGHTEDSNYHKQIYIKK
jgi:hypothetical protein